jgi:biotin carboxylase
MLGAGFEQNIAIKYAQELGLEVIAVDANKNAIELTKADVGIISDIKDIKEMIKIGKKFQVDGVMTHGVEIPYIVSKVAEALNKPGLKSIISNRATDKLLRNECFKHKNIPSARFIFAKSKDEAINKSKKLKFPLVIKPTDNSGARGVSKVNKSEEIAKKYDETVSFSNNKIVLLEEFMEGPQISTESIIIKNKIITTGFADRNYEKASIFEPYFIEDGHTIPSNISNELKIKVIKVVEKAIAALGIDFGVAKGDIIIHNGEPKVLEMATRTSGGRFATDMVPLSSGINIIKPLIQMSVGEKIDMDYLTSKFQRAAAQRFFFPNPGKLVSIEGLEEAKKIEGVYDIFINPEIKIGSIIKKVKNHSDRVGHVIATAEKRENAIKIAENVIKSVRFVTS